MALNKVIYTATLLALLIQECGIAPLNTRNTRIVGGQVAAAGFWPWMASIHGSGNFHFCGGSLITNEWVISAAHCFQGTIPSSLTVYLGRQTQEGTNSNEVAVGVSQIINNPNYNSATSDNDIALLRLASTVTFTNYIRPVCLAASDSTFFNGTDTWVTGWGNIQSGVSLPSPGNLMEVEVPVVGSRQCNCNYGVGTITDNMICAGLEDGGRDSCQGDSGGPMVSKQNGRWLLVGAVSFGRGCAEPNFPGVYARVSQYQTWINSQIVTNQPSYITFTSTGTDGDLSVNCAGLPPAPTNPPTTPAPVVCGQAPLNSRIVGGSSVATAGVWPWMASLQKNGGHVCGGTLVAVDSVLSNANCFSSSPTPSEWTVVLGRLNQNGLNPFEVTLNVTNITLSNLTGSNVAVLHLSSQPTLSNYIQPICLDNGQTFAVGSTAWGSGWNSGRGGEEQALQEFQTSVVDCGNSSSSDTICTGSFTLEEGDSGGPLMSKVDGSWFQASVLSFENNSTRIVRADAVMVLTRLSHFQQFLSSTIGTFLSPASSTSSSTTASANTIATTTTSSSVDGPAHSSFFIFFHLLVLSLCLQLFV
ncbi:transmembrane protease serine 9-like [Cheilinus undulatus]|uniref:transmembrane protease serine 9-like n=1 Tax=Cheilinus undulatus TaxID=241271 RepID=UPI001BD595B1|nr:transmembrane protease serine 9-like [Cheilinus undulatus]